MQTVDLIITDIDWLITVDPGRRIIRDAAIAVDGGKIVAVGKSAEIAKSYSGKQTDRRPQHRGDAGLRRLPSAFVVPALARARRRGQRAVVPVRPHVSLRGRARRRGRAGVGDARRRRTAQARRHLLHRSRQLPSGGLGRRRDVDRHPHDRVALLVRPDQVGARHPARAHDREHRDGAGARRSGAGEIRQDRQSAARRQRLVPRPQQRLRRTDRRPRQARQEIRHAAADPRLLFLFDPRFQHRPRRPGRDRAAGKARRASTSAC